MELPIQFLKELPQGTIQTGKLSSEEISESEDKMYLCRNCLAEITAQKYEISKKGKFSHSFTNPSGYLFEIGCFSEAEGGFALGDDTREFTWFPGFSWQYSVCISCGTHLGWFYSNPSESFWGLILEKLIQPD